MKQLSGSASVSVAAPPARCLELLRAVERYPAWYGERVRSVAVIERGADGLPSVVQATLRVEVGPFAQDVHVLLQVHSDESSVTLVRIPHEPDDPERLEVRWVLSGSSLSVELAATLDVPRLVPVGGAGDSLASGFVQAAARALAGERSSPNASASSS